MWLGNVRGNRHGFKHRTMKPSDYDFFKFSFQESAKYDLPSQIKYVLKKTKASKLIYFGHSMGTTQMFAALSDPQTS